MKQIYEHIHKVHHQHRITISLASVYAHPIEYIFGNLVSVAAGPAILGNHMHIATVFTWYALTIMSTADGHSGYEFSWSWFNWQPADSEYHNFHHLHNIGNYSSVFTIWDTVLGTNKIYYKYVEDKAKTKAM